MLKSKSSLLTILVIGFLFSFNQLSAQISSPDKGPSSPVDTGGGSGGSTGGGSTEPCDWTYAEGFALGTLLGEENREAEMIATFEDFRVTCRDYAYGVFDGYTEATQYPGFYTGDCNSATLVCTQNDPDWEGYEHHLGSD